MSLFSWSAFITAIVAIVAHYRKQRRSIRGIKGPPAPSGLTGHEMQLRNQEQVGGLEFQWVRQYGTTWRTKTCFNRDVLWTTDPSAVNYILHTSGYRYPKPKAIRQVIKNHVGKGLLAAAGDAHQRQRKVMLPAFTVAQLRTFVPTFRRSACLLSQKWKDEIESSATVINVHRMLTRMTLDIIGEAGFDYSFGALDNEENELAREFKGLFLDSVLFPSAWDLLFKATWRYIPDSVLNFVRYLPTKENRRFRHFLNSIFCTGRELIYHKSPSIEKGSKDIMSILVQSNLSEDENRRISEEEMLSQLATFLLAGHDSVAFSLVWILYELSKNEEDQQKVREEIRAARTEFKARGDEDFTPADFEGMTFMNAVIKEVLRLHPIVPTIFREAGGDDTIPLSKPMETTSGKVINEVPVYKCLPVVISVCAYNRLPSVWGEDADDWNPSRFLDGTIDKRISVGLFADLLTFSAGVHGCLGWRFAVLEMQAILTELVETFEFKMPKDVEIVRLNAGLTIPIVKGKLRLGAQMPLNVSVV